MQDILDVLLDEENREPISMVNSEGRVVQFEQIAVIPYDNKIYCVLRPLSFEGVADDEALVFYLELSDDGETSKIVLEEDELKAITVFEKYYDLVDEAISKH
jgi:uncharacterized protein YrzB (UPF0473 family)